MNSQNTPADDRRAPGWLTWSIILGIPSVVSIVGISIGAQLVEIVIFSMLCLFTMALVFFYALG
ncbi:MAG: hypothetical protein JNJ77_17475 [Planctomycetia bacterium]|nr:hypothetical protein [Planctomycetia bacterium]